MSSSISAMSSVPCRTDEVEVSCARAAAAVMMLGLTILAIVLRIFCLNLRDAVETMKMDASPWSLVYISMTGLVAAGMQLVVVDDRSWRVAWYAIANFLVHFFDAVSDFAVSQDLRLLGIRIQMLGLYPAFFASGALLMQLTRECLASVTVAIGAHTVGLLNCLIYIFYSAVAAVVLTMLVVLAMRWRMPPQLLGLLSWFCVCSWLFWLVYAMRVLLSGAALAREAAKNAAPRQAEECRRAAKSVLQNVLGCTAAGLTTAANGLVFSMKQGYMWPVPQLQFNRLGDELYSVIVFIDCLGNSAGALYLSGACSGARTAAKKRKAEETARRRAWSKAAHHACESADASWVSKVHELSCRGFSLKSLLDFYRGLGIDYMVHFDPARHSTGDVVRQAVIPMSAASGSALASVLMHGEATRPGKMVTHNWGNLFRDLVAAIIADALEEQEYLRISELLNGGHIDLLETWCKSAGKLRSSYWVCAFSVNQHCTICDQNPHGGRDSVTNELYPLCECAVPKVSNTSDPASCEVNKFDDMMKLLSASDPSFEQVVAIDYEFDLFTRAWCVAELAAASDMGMRQRLKFSSEQRLFEKQDALKKLKIQNMEASRPEDKALILAKIENVNAFNAQLQRLLFDDLLPAWNDLDAVEQVHRLARIARWQHLERERACSTPGSSLASAFPAGSLRGGGMSAG